VEKEINVLIVDYQKSTRRGLRALLRFSPLINQIWEANDGEAAINIIKEVKPNLVIADVQTPVIGGIDITKWIRENQLGIKVIILTMYPFYKDKALAAGADRYLIKGGGDYCIQDEIFSLFHPGPEVIIEGSKFNNILSGRQI
jgi:DNA-binding NarL/FixJ family response regulator